jgi:N6-adenosine-specific RNA methylase IME4
MAGKGGSAVIWPFDPLRPLSFGAILADPPWAYDMRSEKGYEKSPEAHYGTLDEAAIAALPVGHLAGRDCLLWLWSTWPHLEAALRVMRAWGFTYKTGGSWTKLTPSGKHAFGTGYILRSTTEPFLIGTIGEPRYGSRSLRNVIESLRREHSRKPPEARAMIERLLPHVHACELFAREPWPGHSVWGAETGRFSVGETEAGGEHAGSLAIGRAVAITPAAMLARDPVVNPEHVDPELAVARTGDLLGQAPEALAIEGDAAQLGRDRQRAQRLDGGLAILEGGGGRGEEDQEDGDERSHDGHPRGARR